MRRPTLVGAGDADCLMPHRQGHSRDRIVHKCALWQLGSLFLLVHYTAMVMGTMQCV